MDQHPSHPVGIAHTTTRIEALTDGVFAIVLTLMVFDIRLPEGTGEPLAASLAALWPKFFAYAVSFVQLGIYWIGHRNQFPYITREDHGLRWISLLFLALVALIPFSAQLLGANLRDPLALAVYAGNLIAVGLVLTGHWLYATHGGRLVSTTVTAGVVAVGFRRTLTAPILYAVALLLALVSPVLTLELFAVVPVFYLFPSLIDRVWGVPRPRPRA
jgi:uncharacterized membrane protein